LDDEKALFREVLVDRISLVRHIMRELETAPSLTGKADQIIDELEPSFTSEEARRQFETAVDWGCYAELFTYDDKAGELRLDVEHRVPTRGAKATT